MHTLILAQATPTQPADWVLFWGHFHPLIVHLPIGFLLIAGLLELDRLIRRNPVSSHIITLILFWSAVSATTACVFGYMLSLGGGYDANTLNYHKWEGIGVAVLAWLAWAVKSENMGRVMPIIRRAYLPILTVTLVLMLMAGHLGGNLTHGDDYLTQYAPAPVRALAGLPEKQVTFKAEPITDVNQALVYGQIINPILQTRCVQCHNANKAKAGLRLDTPDQIRKGYEDGPVLTAGKGANSELVKVCLLPPDDDHHMPPKGKTQLTDSQVALLTWWIDQGASFDKKVSQLTVSEPIRPVLASLAGGAPVENASVAVASSGGSHIPESAVLTMKMPAANPTVVEELKKTGLLVLPLSKEQNQLEVSAVNVPSFGDAQAGLLTKLSTQLVWLKLGDTQVTDAALSSIGKLTNLQKLHLEGTKVTDAGLKRLTGLKNLEYLNLYDTAITDAGLATLASLPTLKSLYLWQTKVTPEGVAALQRANPTLEISSGTDAKTLADFTKPEPEKSVQK